MKLGKTVTIFLFVFFTIVLTGGIKNASAAGLKIAVVNMQKIISMSKQGKKADAILHSLATKDKEKLAKLRQKAASLQSDLKKNSSIMSASEKAHKTKEFEADVTNYSSQERRFESSLSKKRIELLKGIIVKIDGIVAKIAKKNGYALVVDRPTVVYRINSISITSQVLNKLNSK